MPSTTTTTWAAMEAERAFTRAVRAGRRERALARVLRRCVACLHLAVADDLVTGPRAGGRPGLREIAPDAIVATTEPHRSAEFDHDFHPSTRTRERWLRVWSAHARGTALPPISVTRVGDGYAIRDGHHRVSVARARGACTITASVA